QFFRLSQVPQPARIFLFVEEHPDSIDDGYFLNKAESPFEWHDLPASDHGGATDFSYLDGPVEPYRGRYWHTKPLPRPGAAKLPFPVPANEQDDFRWLMYRTTISY